MSEYLEHEWQVSAEDVSTRIDAFITSQLAGSVSRTQVQNWLKSGSILVNDQSVKANYKLQLGDSIVCQQPEAEAPDIIAEPMAIDFVYEDQHLAVINKPRGLVVHPAPGHYTGTLVNGLLAHCHDLSGINGVLRPGIVHRIDKDTSGLIMIAKHDVVHRALAEQLKEHSVTRYYLAIVQGVIPHETGTIDAPIGRDPHDRQAMCVSERNSKQAVTHFQVVERFREHTLVRLKLETGRTHQIRVHMKYIGHPLVGDPKYGGGKTTKWIAGQALHAAVLGFDHPIRNERMQFEATLPADMVELLHWLKLQ
jgi:23S rRNA pseudouridine1911/1915/1917 synthase